MKPVITDEMHAGGKREVILCGILIWGKILGADNVVEYLRGDTEQTDK